MALALYRKYRPQTFKELVNQNHVKTTLLNELSTGTTTHAYLFSGPRGLGKTTVARLLAKSVNCLQRKKGNGEPCDDCQSCQEIAAGRSLDVIEIDAASHTGVDNVRENIIANARFTPTSRNFKVFIIDEVHMLSTSAFNALLKTLEEPPAHAMFILATTEIHKVPETIISRCQRFDFRPVSRDDLVGRLSFIVGQEKKKVDTEVLETIVRLADGSIRDAESLLGQVLSLDDKTITKEQAALVLPSSALGSVVELFGCLTRHDAVAGLQLINTLITEGVDLNQFTRDVVEVGRTMLLLKLNSQLADFSLHLETSLEKDITKLLEHLSTRELVKIIERFIVAQRQLPNAEILQLPLELAVVELCQTDNPIDGSTAGGGVAAKAEPAPSLTKPKKPAKNTEPVKQVTAPTEPIKAEEKRISKIKLTIDQVLARWHEVLNALKDHNQSLASTLKHHVPTAVSEDGVIEISFKYKFYQQRIKENKNLEILERTLENIFNIPLRVETILVKQLPQAVASPVAAEAKDGLESIVQSFGGQIIE